MFNNPKLQADVAALGATVLSIFKLIPWAELAGFFAAIYWLVCLYYKYKNRGKD